MKGNKDKCYVVLSSHDTVHVNIGTSEVVNRKCQKLLCVNIDSKLTFEDHINSICKKANAKLNVLNQVSQYMDSIKRRLVNTVFMSQFYYYYPLTWMFHSRKLNNKIKRLYDRCLSLIYSDRISSYEELLDKDNSVSVHHRCLQKLATEMFQT